MRKVLIILTLIIFGVSLFTFSKPVIAKADDLIIDENGAVTLIITDDSVLAATTTASSAPATSAPAPAPAAPQPEPKKEAPKEAPKVVPVAPPNSNTTVKISPTTTTDKKLNITIQTSSNTPAPLGSPKPTAQAAKTTSIASPTSTPVPANTQTMQKTVDNVILRDANKAPVVTINADQNQTDQINIKQQDVNVTTQLPIQIDSKTHVVSIDTGNNTTQEVSVLPDQAVKGANDKLTSSNLTTTSSSVSLVQDRGQAEYIVNQTKTGKLFGVITLTLPSQVKISAQTGKTISVWQSPLSYFAGLFTK